MTRPEEKVHTSIDRSTTLQRLSQWDITGIGLHPGGSNYVFVVKLQQDDQEEIYAIYKPAAGERPLRDFPYGTLHNREWCAATIAQTLGWPAIPPTVIRKGPHGIGSIQLFIDADFSKHYFNMRDDRLQDFAPIAMFDVLVNNADRKGGSCLMQADGEIWAVDHGLTFNPDARRRTVMFEFNGTPYPQNLIPSLTELMHRLEDKDSELRTEIADALEPEELDSLIQRGNHMLQEPYFPILDPDWNVPWPMI